MNVLNLLDVVLTRASLSAGARELNPFVTRFGMGWKIAVVAVASWGLYRVRPRALWIPAAALGAVLIYQAMSLTLPL